MTDLISKRPLRKELVNPVGGAEGRVKGISGDRLTEVVAEGFSEQRSTHPVKTLAAFERTRGLV